MNGIFFLNVRWCLQYWMNTTYLHNCFWSTQGLLSLKIIRNKQTGESIGYGFLDFVIHTAAQMALQNYNGVHMLNAEKFYSLNVEHWLSLMTNHKWQRKSKIDYMDKGGWWHGKNDIGSIATPNEPNDPFCGHLFLHEKWSPHTW